MAERFSPEDWLELGLKQLANHGPSALKIKAMCKAANRTIGSFYHHFSDQDAFFKALSKHWHKTNTDEVIAAIDQIENIHDYEQLLKTLAENMNQAVDLGMRNFAEQNEIVARAVAEVDEKRISFSTQLFMARFDIDELQARDFAELEYAAFIGTQTLWRSKDLKQGLKLSGLFNGMLASYMAAKKG